MTEVTAQILRDAITVLFGALAGGVTNRVAILMLFHPYEPPKVLGHRIEWLQGAVPKNRERLARTVGRTIGTTLLTPADVAAELQDERLRDAFEQQLRSLLAELLEGEKPALSELLPESALLELRRILEMLLDSVNIGDTGSEPGHNLTDWSNIFDLQKRGIKRLCPDNPAETNLLEQDLNLGRREKLGLAVKYVLCLVGEIVPA